MDREIIKRLLTSWLGAGIRLLLVGVGAWLKASGKLPAAVNDSLLGVLSEWAARSPELAGNLLLGGAAGWTLIQKWRNAHTLQAVKDAPSGTSIPAARAIAKELKAAIENPEAL